MEKIISVGEYKFPVKSTAASLLSYRRNFGRDGMKDLLALVKGAGKGAAKKKADEVALEAFVDSAFEIETLYRFIWVFAKAADSTILPMEEWLDTFEVSALDFVSEVFPQVSDLLFSMTQTSVNPRKK